MNNQYSFQAPPKPVKLLKKQKEQGAINITIYKNLMNDKRIRRGNNYSAYKKLESHEKRLNPEKKTRFKLKKKKQATKTELKYLKKEKNKRRSIFFVEALNLVKSQNKKKTSKGVFVEHEKRLQTNLPEFYEKETMTEVPLKKKEINLEYTFEYGIDKEIQVEETEIFNFEKEIEPLVEILKRRILEDSFVEVLRETEIEKLQNKQKMLKIVNKMEKDKLKFFINEKKKKMVEKKKIQKLFQRKKIEKMRVHEKMVSREYSKKYISILENNFKDYLNIFDKGIKGFDFIYINDNYKFYLEKNILVEINKKKKKEEILKRFIAEKVIININQHEKSVNFENKRLKELKERLEKEAEEKRIKKIAKICRKRLEKREKKVGIMKEIFSENFKKILIEKKHVKIFDIFPLSKFDCGIYKKGGFIFGGGLLEIFSFFNYLKKIEENSFDFYLNIFEKIFENFEKSKIKIVFKFKEKIIDDFDEKEIEIEEINFENLRNIEKKNFIQLLTYNLICNFKEKNFLEIFLPFLFEIILESKTNIFEILIEEVKIEENEEKIIKKEKKKNLFIILEENLEEKDIENSQEIILSNFQKICNKKIFETSDLNNIFSEKLNFNQYTNFIPNSEEVFDNEFLISNFSLHYQLKNIFCDFIENEYGLDDTEAFKKTLEKLLTEVNKKFISEKKEHYPKFEFILTLI